MPDAPTTHCLDCGAALTGKYCAQCGQKLEPLHESLWQLLKDAVTGSVVLESKLWRTLSTLLFRPGALTRAYLIGQRARFVRPFKLYFWVSVVFFFLLTLGPLSGFRGGATTEGSGLTLLSKSGEEISETAKQRGELFSKLGKEIGEACSSSADGCDPQKMDTIWQGYGPILRSFVARLPKVAFLLLPLFALLLKLPWSKVRFVTHFIFALHWHTVLFINMMVSLVLWAPMVSVVDLASLAWSVIAIRRFYGSNWLVTALKMVVLLGLHAAVVGLTVLALFTAFTGL